MCANAGRFYGFGSYRLDTVDCVLLRGREIVSLSPKAFEILRILVQNSPHLVTKKDLMAAVWPDSCVEEANLTVNVSVLRKVLGRDVDGRRFIETVPKRGYRFEAEVRVEPDPEASATPSRIGSLPKGHTLVLCCVGLIAAIAASLVERTTTGYPAAGPIRSIAVLPFRSLNSKPHDDDLGLGITDALITRLGALQRVAVQPTSAVRRFLWLDQDSVAFGRQLRVDTVLEGSIQTLGSRIRTTVRLLRVADGAPLWADKFERESADIFALEDSISNELAAALDSKLTAAEDRRLGKYRTGSNAAHQLYLKGRYFSNRGTAEAIPKAIQCFEQAIQADSKYAAAYAALADSYLLMGSHGGGSLPPRDALRRAEAAAETALSLDDSLAEVHASLGYARLIDDWRWLEAGKELRRAIELNPLSSAAHHWYAHYLIALGQREESYDESRRALEIDPVDVVLNEHLGWHYLMARQYDLAIDQCRKTLDMDPALIQPRRVLGLAYLYKGDVPRAIEELQNSLRRSEADPVTEALLARAFAAAGRRAEAKRVLGRLKELSNQRYVSSADTAAIYAGLGDKDEAFRWLEKAHGERSHSLIYLQADLGWEPLRADPRFSRLTRIIGLP
jgi:DNA-binding winged helix-turn-helix (wHTH) protein/TolB-like protein/Tfp pilus assembly protein PilF